MVIPYFTFNDTLSGRTTNPNRINLFDRVVIVAMKFFFLLVRDKSGGVVNSAFLSICNEFDDNIEFKLKLIKSYENTRKLIVIPRYVETFQVFMTLLYLAANNNRPDNYEDWVKNFYK